MNEDRWSRGAQPLQKGGLDGWKASDPPEERHRAIERVVRTDGYAKAIERLDYIANVADRKNNRLEHNAARADIEWTREWEDRERDDEDRRREQGTHHRVEGFERTVDGRRERVRPHLARNPRR